MIEPTQPGKPYHYSNINDIPLPPPPPPAEYYMQQRTGKLWKFSIPILMLLFLGIIAILAYPVVMSIVKPSKDVTPTPYVPFSLGATTNQSTPTAITKVYDARAIVSDLQQAGLQAANIQYGVPACSNKIVGLQSEACFNNASLCNLQCDEDSVWVQVFDTTQNAQLDYQQWVQSDGPVPSTIFTGHCVVVGNFMNGTYAKIIAHDCQ